jgi:hypothetical protein
MDLETSTLQLRNYLLWLQERGQIYPKPNSSPLAAIFLNKASLEIPAVDTMFRNLLGKLKLHDSEFEVFDCKDVDRVEVSFVFKIVFQTRGSNTEAGARTIYTHDIRALEEDPSLRKETWVDLQSLRQYLSNLVV